MSEDYLAQAQPTQTWNTVRGVWEKQGIANLLCEHWELFSETWQTAGTMRNGKVYELPTQAHHITDSEFSSLPTPAARDYKDGSAEHERDGVIQTDTVARAIFNSGEVLLPTTTASDWKGANHSGSASASSRGIATAVEKTAWGKFEPAIRRWEQTLGRPAPLPTKPDGKDGSHRLSSAFTEWMMGLPEGWVTGVGLTRNEELKACGNGVVPQQAELALRILLEGVTLPAGGGQVNLPTPTVSDTYTDNLKSTQQKEGSMHSVTLPQAVRMVSDRIEASQGNVIPDPQTDNRGVGSYHSATSDRQNQ